MYRKGTVLKYKTYNFLLHQGGVGDLIAQLPALKYVLDCHKQVIINLWVHEYAVEFTKEVLKGYKNLSIRGLEKSDQFEKGYTRTPYMHQISNLSMHLTDHAFISLVGTEAEDKYKNYIELTPIDISSFNLPEKYVVVTTGYTSKAREWNVDSINGTVDYIIKMGHTPVFIGKSYTHAYGTEGIKGNFEADYSKGINLIDKTNLFEAHAIMDKSKAVIGLDNGLLHLAAMSPNTKIVYGFTSVEPRHRLPYRNGILGHNCFVVQADREKVKCLGCQSNMNFMDTTHDFRDCAYGDYLCTQELKSELFIEQLEKIFKGITPQEKSEVAYQEILNTQKLNEQLKELGIQKPMKYPKCDCGTLLEFRTSSCTDPECCGQPHTIECDNCGIETEYYDFIDFENAWEDLGGNKKDLYE